MCTQHCFWLLKIPCEIQLFHRKASNQERQVFSCNGHAQIQKVCEMGSNFDFFLFDEGRMDPNTTISGPSMCRQIMAQHWELCDLKGIRTSIAEKPYNFCNFPGGGGGVRTPLDPHMMARP